MIVAIEGGDACGKATQATILAKALGAELFSFPDYRTPAGKLILENLKRQWRAGVVSTHGDLQNAFVLQSLMNTNRLERMSALATAAAQGHVVIDRYAASGFVYGELDGLDRLWLEHLNSELRIHPDMYILIDVPVDEGFRRRPERRDRYEKDRDYLERVRIGYLRLFKDQQDKYIRMYRPRGAGFDLVNRLGHPIPRWRIVDGTGTVEEVSARIWEVLSA